MSAFQYQENGGGKVKGPQQQMMGIGAFPVIHSIGKAATTDILMFDGGNNTFIGSNQVIQEGGFNDVFIERSIYFILFYFKSISDKEK